MYPLQMNTKMNHERLIDGRECWNGITFSTGVSSWKTPDGGVSRLLTMKADSEF